MSTSSGFSAPIVNSFVRLCERLRSQHPIDRAGASDGSGAEGDPGRLPAALTTEVIDGAIVVGDPGSEIRQALEHCVRIPWASLAEPAEHAVLFDADVAGYGTADSAHAAPPLLTMLEPDFGASGGAAMEMLNQLVAGRSGVRTAVKNSAVPGDA